MDNPGFDSDDKKKYVNWEHKKKCSKDDDNDQNQGEWSSPIEFLLSCVAMSVGLGNIWRFPMVAMENGGGAFLIPYLLVLTFIGRPLYFMELGIGQFSSSGPVKMWSLVPAFKGIGWAQCIGSATIVTYYCAIMALSIFYFAMSFQSTLPYAVCDEEYSDSNCYSANGNLSMISNTSVSSAEYYFYNYVLKQPENINDGIGNPDWKLTLCLLASWVIIFISLSFGVKSSGKVAYFTALFPYVVLITLLIRGVTLPGSGEGIIYFLTPKIEKLLEIDVWYAAVTQSFFSLSVCYGTLPMFASHNNFRHNVYRDAWIISFADTFTSILAGMTIFSIIGNLKYETGAEDITDVVSVGPGLAFVSYPTTIAKFDWVPQFFAAVFFLMLFTLGLGSATGLIGMIIKVIHEQFPRVPYIVITAICCILGFVIGLMYVTPGGIILIDIMDFFGGNIIIYIVAVIEILAIMYIYGMQRLCHDFKFMQNVSLSIYWKLSWGFIIPVSLTGILIYVFVDFKYPTYTNPFEEMEKEYEYPQTILICGWVLFGVAISFIPIGLIHAIYKSEGDTFVQKFKTSFRPKERWGPANPRNKLEWKEYNKVSSPDTLKDEINNIKNILTCQCFKKSTKSVDLIINPIHDEERY